jgi:hypothetical protein
MLLLQRATLLLAAAAPAAAQFPTVDVLLPRGVQRGTEVELDFRGKQLTDAQDLMVDDARLELLGLEQESEGRVRARVRVDADCALGLHAVRLRTSTGLSNLVTLAVGDLPFVDEAEPNGALAEAQAIELGCTVRGVAANEDIDLYAFDGRAGERVAVEVEGLRLGSRPLDPAIALLDAEGFVLVARDDIALARQDAALTYTLPADGRYVVRVRESAYRGANDYRYLLHVGRFPRPLALLPLGGPAGQPLDVLLLGDDGEEGRTTVTVPAARAAGGWAPVGVAPVHVADANGVAPTPNWLRVSDLPNVLEVEPNAAVEEATPFTPPAALNGVLGSDQDYDRYVFSARKGVEYEASVWARRLRTPVDALLIVSQKDGKELGRNDDTEGNPDSTVRFKAPQDGELLLTVRDHLWRGGPAFAYRLEVQRVQPRLSATAAGREQAVVVPRGGRAIVNLQVERTDLSGPVEVALEGLPAGVRAYAPAMPRAVGQRPVVLEADADAPLAHAHCALSLTQATGGVTGGYREDVTLVQGRNQTVYFAHTLDRLPVAVTAAAPLAVRLEVPAVPLPQNGFLEVEAVIERGAGCDGDVLVTLPFLSPGLNAVRQLTIKQGADRGRFTLNTAPDAAPGAWPLLAIAETELAGSRVRVGSEPAQLTITPPFVTVSAQALSVEQGETGEMLVTVAALADFPGGGALRLVGLPHEAAAADMPLGADTQELVVAITTTAKSPVGKHKGLAFNAVFELEHGRVVQALPAAELRIQKPTVVAQAQPAPQPAPAQPKKERPPTRLEKLRALHEARKAQGDEEGGGR